MSVYGVKVPDVGEGVAEAELVAWQVAVGDVVTTESVLAEVMTDKATVEISSPVSGIVVALHGEPGDVLTVGNDLVGIELDATSPASSAPVAPADPAAETAYDKVEEVEEIEEIEDAEEPCSADAAARVEPEQEPVPEGDRTGRRPGASRPTAAPAVRARADDLGIELAAVTGSGPDGRILHRDLDRLLLGGAGPRRSVGEHPAARQGAEPSEARVEPIRGVRRRIAQRLSAAWSEIPHITYVESVDLTELEALRAELNGRATGAPRLTVLPFLARAMVIALRDQPSVNATYDAAAEALTISGAVHLGIATQTDDGLMVPVVRDADRLDLRGLAGEIARVAAAARDGSATRDELTGSTITITSLGALGGLMTTPIINQPEVAIVGVNKIETRPVWRSDRFEPRLVCNLSSSFDHRIVDGWDAAVFVQRIRSLLEMPALLFVDGSA